MNEDLESLLSAAEGGDVAAAFDVGCRFSKGSECVEKDVCKAARYFKMAADQGHADAQCDYGSCLVDGEGVEKDVCEAARYFKMAADQGHAGGQCGYGFCLEHGEGVEKDVCEAASYYKLAADQGHAGGQSNYGFCLEHGEVKDVLSPFKIQWKFYNLQNNGCAHIYISK